MSIFLNDWKDSGLGGLKSDFGIDDAALAGAEILFASYTYEDYSGSAFVLFRRDGKLYEVNAGHCSCYGLSECGYGADDDRTQWEPEETTAAALLQRLDSHYDFDGCREELRAVLKGLD